MGSESSLRRKCSSGSVRRLDLYTLFSRVGRAAEIRFWLPLASSLVMSKSQASLSLCTAWVRGQTIAGPSSLSWSQIVIAKKTHGTLH